MRSTDVLSAPRVRKSSQELIRDVERRQAELMAELSQEQRSRLGQFMTPSSVAALMASMFGQVSSDVRVLDPGAGIGMLTAAFVAHSLAQKTPPKAITATAYELDRGLVPELEATLRSCAGACADAGVKFTSHVLAADFIEASSRPARTGKPAPPFTHVIVNPPYKKIRMSSDARAGARRLGVEVTNLYAAFVVAAVRRLGDGGHLVAITPRSFCNGTYFAPFRRFLLKETSFRRIHLFESRRAAFRGDDVLQENIIVSAVRGGGRNVKVTLSISSGPDDSATLRKVPFSRVVAPGDPAVFIRIASAAEHDVAARRITSFGHTLSDLGMNVSTGRVVDFRASAYLRGAAGPECYPLIYPIHFDRGFVEWPRATKKPNAIVYSADTADLLLPNGPYVLVRRFSAKEERRRVNAAFYAGHLPFKFVAFENHLNYFHNGGAPLETALARGLLLYLSSSLVDTYVREFSGHTQVNAQDLRSLRYPSRQQLVELGEIPKDMPAQDEIDAAVAALTPTAPQRATIELFPGAAYPPIA